MYGKNTTSVRFVRNLWRKRSLESHHYLVKCVSQGKEGPVFKQNTVLLTYKITQKYVAAVTDFLRPPPGTGNYNPFGFCKMSWVRL